MIIKICKRGERLYGLLWYLWSPGRRNEHVNPHLVAAWDDDLERLEPAIKADGKRDFSKLVSLMEQPLAALPRRPQKPVYHVVASLSPGDPQLTEQDWANISHDIVQELNLAPAGDDHGVRWISMAHDDRHLHMPVTLARQDGRVPNIHNDYRRARNLAIKLEKKYSLRSTAPADKTSVPAVGRHEMDKARRAGRSETYREQLRRNVRIAAAAVDTSDEFWERLRDSGLLVKPRYSQLDPTAITGYAVGLPSHKTANGQPVWYGGGRLAPDLTLPKLRERWGEHIPSPAPSAGASARRRFTAAERSQAYGSASGAVRDATEELRRQISIDPAAAAAAARAGADVLSSVTRAAYGSRRGPLWEATELLDRATRSPYGERLPRTSRSDTLRAMSRALAVAGRLSGGSDTLAAARLIIDLAALADAVRDLKTARNLLHQAKAARASAEQLRSLAATSLAAPAQDAPARRRVHRDAAVRDRNLSEGL